MNSPIADFVNNCIKNNTARLHMPGHKGVPNIGCEPFDITEISGADELYAPSGIILESEKNASRIFNTSRTVYSAGGSSQSINAMLFLALQNTKSKSKTVVAGRNVHKSFIYGAAKLDLNVEWIYPEKSESICRCIVTETSLKKALDSLNEKPIAVYITSPDYLGGISDIKSLSEVCRAREIPLIVDNAHGSYLAFCENSMHPIHLGADICCDSAHKTLPVLTGGGYLHIAKDDKYGFSKNAVRAMEIFGSTSPSYLILQSLDLCNKYLNGKIASDIKKCIEKTSEIKKLMKNIGIPDISEEPLKITSDFSGFEPFACGFSQHFRNSGIEFEYSDKDFIVFMISPQNSDSDFEKLRKSFKTLPPLTPKPNSPILLPKCEKVMSIRDAVFGDFEEVDIEDATGRICSVPTVSCPPAVPIAVSGEKITKEHIKLFKNYGINKVAVIKTL